MASCRTETQAYRKCLKDSHASGCSNGAKKCKPAAIKLEACREQYRKENQSAPLTFDGTRVLPNAKCQPLNAKVQQCLKWKKGDQSQCQEEIQALHHCMKDSKGIVAAPTEGDKVWSDYKGKK